MHQRGRLRLHKGDVLGGSRVFYRPRKSAGQVGIVYVNAQARDLLTHMGKASGSDTLPVAAVCPPLSEGITFDRMHTTLRKAPNKRTPR